MGRYTTEEPLYIALDEADFLNYTQFKSTIEEDPVNTARVVALSISFILGIVSSLCLLVTVIKTKTVRNQLMGVLLISMAVATLVSTCVLSRWLELEVRGGKHNFGSVECHLSYIFLYVSVAVFNATVILLGLDATFNLPQNKTVTFAVTLSIWLISMIFSLVLLYGFGTGPHVVQISDGYSYCTLGFGSYDTYEVIVHILFEIVPTIFLLIAFIKSCCLCRGNKAPSDGKMLPFVLMAITFLVLIWTEYFVYIVAIKAGFTSLHAHVYAWAAVMKTYRMPLICFYWLFFFPEIRKFFLCRGPPDDESPLLLRESEMVTMDSL